MDFSRLATTLRVNMRSSNMQLLNWKNALKRVRKYVCVCIVVVSTDYTCVFENELLLIVFRCTNDTNTLNFIAQKQKTNQSHYISH